MKYVLLGNLSPEYASKQSERVKKAKAKLDKLGIKIESIHYTQGHYDFVDIVDAPNPEAMLAFLGTNNGLYASDNDATRVGMTLKNLWVGATPRPANIP